MSAELDRGTIYDHLSCFTGGQKVSLVIIFVIRDVLARPLLVRGREKEVVDILLTRRRRNEEVDEEEEEK